MTLLLDTHTILWLTEANPSLGRSARKRCDAALAAGELAIPTAVYYELGYRRKRGRLELTEMRAWRSQVTSMGVREIGLSGEIALQAADLDDLHGDPWDRVIIATAIVEQATLLTADREMLSWTGRLQRQDARR